MFEDFQQLYEDISLTRDQVREKAKLVNCEARFADDKTLQLDLDSKEAVDFFEEQWQFATTQIDHLMYRLPIRETSRNGNTHVTIMLTKPLSAPERIALQAVLGSDPKRELLNLTRYYVAGDDMTCLFRLAPKQLTQGSEANQDAGKDSAS